MSRSITVSEAERLGMAIAHATGDPVRMTVYEAVAAGLKIRERFEKPGITIVVL